MVTLQTYEGGRKAMSHSQNGSLMEMMVMVGVTLKTEKVCVPILSKKVGKEIETINPNHAKVFYPPGNITKM